MKNIKMKIDLIVIASVFREETIPSTITVNELNIMLGEITNKETKKLKKFNKLVNSEEVQNILEKYYKGFSEEDIIKYLELKTYVKFAIPLSHLKLELRSKYTIAFYLYKDLNVIRKKRKFNSLQRKVINKTQGVVIVNAGPGTGKTTTACKKAFELAEEGVIIVSYSNASVNEIKDRIYEFPGASDKIDNKKIIFSTIDKLAFTITKEIDDYEHAIRHATLKMRRENYRYLSSYSHIIVDEAQDINNIRSEFIETLFVESNFESLTVLGDPRQKIKENSGEWYKNLWIKTLSDKEIILQGHTFDLKGVGLNISYRFKNQKILNMINELSSRREELHCELVLNPKLDTSETSETSDSKPILCYNFNNKLSNFESYIVKEICGFIKDKIEEGYSYNDFLCVGPSLDKSNKSSKFCNLLTGLFRENDIPCKLKSEGSYQSRGILFSTIQSVKGMESEFVFIFGMNNYPNAFNIIPYEEAESLIYVAHSRARQKIIYVNGELECNLPRGVDEKHVEFPPEFSGILTKKEDKYSDLKCFSVTSVSTCFGFNKLMKTNKVYIETLDLDFSFPTKDVLILDEIPLDFFGILICLGIQIHSCNKLPEFFKHIAKSKRATLSDCINIKTNENKQISYAILKRLENYTFFNIDEYTNENYFELASILYNALNSADYHYKGTYDFNLKSYFIKLSNSIKNTFGNIINCEHMLEFNCLKGSIDILTDTTIIEIKFTKEDNDSSFLQCQIYRTLFKRYRDAVVINLRTRTCKEVSSNRKTRYWLYLLEQYVSIYKQVHFVRCLKSNESNKFNFPNNSFCIDTEFHNNDIFEIGIFNINDPFSSIVQTIDVREPALSFAVEWLSMDEKMFEQSISMEELRNMFDRLTYLFDETVTFYYYCCNTDHSWYKKECRNIDVGSLTKRESSKNGIFDKKSHSPKLIDFYNSHIYFITFHEHLAHHTAMSDSLMLYAILTKYKI